MARTTRHHEGALDHTKVVADGAHRARETSGASRIYRYPATPPSILETLHPGKSVESFAYSKYRF